MSGIASGEKASAEPEKPASADKDEVRLPPFPDPTDLDFNDITEEEQNHYKKKFPDLGIITTMRLHCTACDRHLGSSPLNESRMRTHPMLRTLICQTCHSFYNSGEFDRGEDGSELYCRWCGQGGQVYCCSDCIHVFCAKCIKRNLGLPKIKEIENTDDWKCFKCNPYCLWDMRALCWALLRYCDLRNKLVDQTEDADLKQKYTKVLAIDQSECCKTKTRKSQKNDSTKKKEKEAENVAQKIKIPAIQVKKFASVNLDNLNKPKIEKKIQKRTSISIAPSAISGGVNKKFRDNLSNIIHEVESSGRNEISRKKIGRPLGSKNKKKLNPQSCSQFPNKIGRPFGTKNKQLKNKVCGKQCSMKQGRPVSSKNKELKMYHHADPHSYLEFTFPKKKGRPLGSKNKVNKTQTRTEPLIYIEAPLVLRGDNAEQQTLPNLITINIGMNNLEGISEKSGRPLKRRRGTPNIFDLTSKEQLQKRQRRTYDRKTKSVSVEVTADDGLMSSPNILNPVRYPIEPLKKASVPRASRPRILVNNFNGCSQRMYNPLNVNSMNSLNMNMISDNINLSLDSLTQGLDFSAMQAMNNPNTFGNNNDVVCTPDFPLEPLCMVTEDTDDDVECITPGPSTSSKPVMGPPPPPVVPPPPQSVTPAPAAISKDNIIQMTDSDVTVNSLTGGLKFRVDPQTLSSNKMYRLPDGRVFAINANPNMPGGYSATIVSQNVDGTPRLTPRSETFAAKLSAVPHSAPKQRARNAPAYKRKVAPKPKATEAPTRDTYISRETDAKVPVEWYRYNLVDAVDALEYSLSRLHKLKKETTTVHLRSRTVDEMKYLHRKLEQLLTTSSKRFIEIRDTLNKEMKLYLTQKETHQTSEDDDDDVEILPNTENEDPIFIDENSDVEVDGDADTAKEHLLGNHDDSDKIDTDDIPETSSIDASEASSDLKTSKLNGDEKTDDKDDKTDDDRSDEDELKRTFIKSDVKSNSPQQKDDDTVDANKQQVDDKVANNKTFLNTGHFIGNDDVGDKLDADANIVTAKDSDKNVDKTFLNTGNFIGNDDVGDKLDADANIVTAKDSDKNVDKTFLNTGNCIGNDDVGDKLDADANIVTAKDSNKNVDLGTDKQVDMSEELIENLLKDDNLEENASMEMADLQEAEEILS